MSVEYRRMRPAKEDAALDLWAASFPLDREFLRREYHGDPRRRIEHTPVGVARRSSCPLHGKDVRATT
jgi:hypothetical protein